MAIYYDLDDDDDDDDDVDDDDDDEALASPEASALIPIYCSISI